jgi:hypothetical protein
LDVLNPDAKEMRMVDRRSGTLGATGVGIWLLASLALSCSGSSITEPIDPLEDTPRQRAMVDSIGAALSGSMSRLSSEESLLIELDELYEPLSAEQREFMDAIRNLEGADPSRKGASGIDWFRVEGQQVSGPSGDETMSLQLLPPEVWAAFRGMNEAMKSDLGRGLVIGSGYRTPANQLFIFVSYLPYYEYSVEKIAPHVSLPGASDHNRVEQQGIDVVSEGGVDLRYGDAEAFKGLDEYQWLMDNAAAHGFVGEGPDSASPWHWHHAGTD